MMGPITFRFLGVEKNVQEKTYWNDPVVDKLWLYNLHYFDDLNALNGELRQAWHLGIIERWINENPPGYGNGWEPYPLSLRIVNWITWTLREHILSPQATHSLAIQIRLLSKKLEYHLLGNHLWANAKALVFAGVFFDGPEALQWRTRGLKLIRRELDEQILMDGGHFERSPMYHAIVLADLLELLALSHVFPCALPDQDISVWHSTASRMLRWLAIMTHPDGDIALFNDSAFGVAPRLKTLAGWAQLLEVDVDLNLSGPLHALPESGYVRLQTAEAVLIADVGPIGPDYLPGHAHADTLSFELSLHDQRVIIDTGTSTYNVSSERLFQRGTAAHNTVIVDGQNSSEVWGSFRVARRARVHDVAWGNDIEFIWLRGAHDGYCRLPGRVTHWREWRLSGNALEIQDVLEGHPRIAEARLLIHPVIQVEKSSHSRVKLLAPRQSKHIEVVSEDLNLDSATWHPSFGETQSATRLRTLFSSNILTTRISW